MAPATSLGVHRPVGLDFLIGEDVLPENPSPDDFQWQTYHDDATLGEEEIIIAGSYVVWSQSGVIRRVLNFDLEEQKITQAVLTWLSIRNDKNQDQKVFAGHGNHPANRSTQPTESNTGEVEAPRAPDHPRGKPKVRSLIVLLNTQAHIYVVDGASHVVNLPFEVECAFPTHQGLVLQRKIHEHESNRPSPIIPDPPANSFFSPLAPIPLQSPPQVVSSKPLKQERGSSVPTISLKDFRIPPQPRSTDNLPRLFTLTDPLAPIGLVVETQPSPRLPSSPFDRLADSFTTTALSDDEELLYISRFDELSMTSASAKERPLMVAMTVNRVQHAYNLWYASYLEAKSVASWMKNLEEARVQARPTSFANVLDRGSIQFDQGRRGGARESFLRSFQDNAPMKPAKREGGRTSESFGIKVAKKGQRTSQGPELTSPEKASIANRRTSSMLARAELTTQEQVGIPDWTKPSAGPVAGGARRGLSFGRTSHGRKSFRMSQGSTRTSLPAYAVELDSSSIQEGLSDLGEKERTAATGYEEFFDLDLEDPFEGMSGKLMVNKVFSVPIRTPWNPDSDEDAMPAPASKMKIISRASEDGRNLSLFVHNKHEKVLSEISLKVQRIAIRAQNEVINAPVLNHGQVHHHFDVVDAEKLVDGDMARVIILRDHALYLLSQRAGLSASRHGATNECFTQLISFPTRFQEQPANDLQSNIQDTNGRVNEMSETPNTRQQIVALANASQYGNIDLIDDTGVFDRVSIQLQPENVYAGKVLRLCRGLLSDTDLSEDAIIAAYWHVLIKVPRDSISEWRCLIVTLFTLLLGHTGHRDLPRHSTPEMPVTFGHNLAGSPVWRSLNKQASAGISPSFLLHCATLSRQCLAEPFLTSVFGLQSPRSANQTSGIVSIAFPNLLLGLHLIRQEEIMDIYSQENSADLHFTLAPALAQMGHFLGWSEWSWKGSWFQAITGSRQCEFDTGTTVADIPSPRFAPPSISRWLANALDGNIKPFPSLADLRTNEADISQRLGALSASRPDSTTIKTTPRIAVLSLLVNPEGPSDSGELLNELLKASPSATSIIDTLPETVLAMVTRYLARKSVERPNAWLREYLKFFNRQSAVHSRKGQIRLVDGSLPHSNITNASKALSVEGICDDIDVPPEHDPPETQGLFELIYRHDTSFDEAQRILRSHTNPIAIIVNKLDLPEARFLEMERRQAQLIGVRSLAVTTGAALLEYHHFNPFPTQEMEIGLWEIQIRMSPSGHIMALAKEHFTEQMSAWAAYHTGVAAGLKIRGGVACIDTSWIVLNKPTEPSNRHAGLLLGLGLSGYLRTVEKWLVFKYLTPKHDMTSISLLLGLGASYLGTMNSLVVRVLSIHLVSLLPPGAAELNLSPLVQTAGTMGVGLLYYNSQHRRMSEVMLSELEYIDKDDSEGVFIRDEGYRLAAGFALGFINLHHGADLRALHDMRIKERLLHLVTTSRDTNIVNVLDRATPGATVALALMFMKTHDAALAQRIDVPSTRPQFDYVRPDVALLRVVARNLIMWDEIEPSEDWIFSRLPADLQDDIRQAHAKSKGQYCMAGYIKSPLSSVNMHLYNTIAGLCWSISLKYAGSGNTAARDCILKYYDSFTEVQLLQALSFDRRLTLSSLSRLQHLLLLSAATVMAATGDLEVLRRARICHADVTPDSTFGTHQATHMALGALFLGQGRFTFCTSDLAVGSLLCAFYPLFPKDVQDNKAHLQAFRHMWVFATEPRCLIPRDTETQQPVLTSLEVTLTNGSSSVVEAPVLLLPSLESIASVRTLSDQYWPVTLHLANDPSAVARFKEDQTLWLTRRSILDQHNHDPYAVTLAQKREKDARGTTHAKTLTPSLRSDIFSLPVFPRTGLSTADLDSIFPRPPSSADASDQGLHSRRANRETEEWQAKRRKEREDRKNRKMQQVLLVPGVMGRHKPAVPAHGPGRASDSLAAGFLDGDDGLEGEGEGEVEREGLESNDARGVRTSVETLLHLGTTRVDDVLNLWGSTKVPARRHELEQLFAAEGERGDDGGGGGTGAIGREVCLRLGAELAIRDAGVDVEALLGGRGVPVRGWDGDGEGDPWGAITGVERAVRGSDLSEGEMDVDG